MIERSMAGVAKKTFADLEALGEDTRCELIRGELVPKASPMAEHSEAEGGLAVWLTRRFQRSSAGVWPGGWWIRLEIHTGYADHEIYCHDLAGWRRDRHPKPAGWPVRETPDWVCEVLSRGHEKRDRVTKLETLHEAGVPHYWLVDHDKKIIEIRRHEPRGYLLVKTLSSGEVVRAEPFDAVELRSGVIFGDEDDEP
jgi:Uma2 family endonuclease